jgi:transposase
VHTLKLCPQGVPYAQDLFALRAGISAPDDRLVRAGHDPEDLAREFEPTSQSIRNWVAQADRSEGRREEKVEPTSSAERDELIKLRREVRQLRLERLIPTLAD